MSPPNEDGLDAFCGDVLLWEPSSVCPSLLVLNKVPSHKITSELPFGWQLLSIWVLWSSNTSRTKQTLSKCFTIKMDLEKVWFLEGVLRAKSDFSFVLLRREWSQHIDKIIPTESRITDCTGERWDHLGDQDLEQVGQNGIPNVNYGIGRRRGSISCIRNGDSPCVQVPVGQGFKVRGTWSPLCDILGF